MIAITQRTDNRQFVLPVHIFVITVVVAACTTFLIKGILAHLI